MTKNEPTADVVPVVRCKDCKHRGYVEVCPMCWEDFPDYDADGGAWYDGITTDRTKDNDFCSRGEEIEAGNRRANDAPIDRAAGRRP